MAAIATSITAATATAPVTSTIIASMAVVTAMAIAVDDIDVNTRIPRIRRRTVITIICRGITWATAGANGFNNA